MKFSQLIPEHTFFALRFFLPPFLVLVLGKTLFEMLAFDFIALNQILTLHTYAVDEIPVTIKLSEIKARLMWLSSVMVCFFIFAGFAIFIWNTLKSSKSKSILFVFIRATCKNH